MGYISPPLSLMKPVQWLSNNRPLDMLLWKSQTEEAAVNQTTQTHSLIVSFPKYHRQPSTKYNNSRFIRGGSFMPFKWKAERDFDFVVISVIGAAGFLLLHVMI